MTRWVAGRWSALLLTGWILAISVARAGRLQETDPYWQVVAGREVLNGTPLARADSWSWAPVEGLFYPNSPAWNIALAHAWDLFGSWGLFFLAAAAIASYLGLLAFLATRLGAGPMATLAAVIVTSLAALPMISARATMAAQVVCMLALAFAAVWATRAPGKRTMTNAIVVGAAGAALSVIGNWIHLSWSPLALAVAVAWFASWILSPGISTRSRVSMTIAGAAGLSVGLVAGPYGLAAFGRAGAVVEACRGLILEWTSPFHPGIAGQWALPAIGALGVATWGCVWCLNSLTANGRTTPEIATAAGLLVIAVPAAAAGMFAVRFVGVALLTVAPVTAKAISLLMARLHLWARMRPDGATSRLVRYTSADTWRVVLTGVLIATAPFTVVYASPHATPNTRDATALLPRDCRLFSPPLEAAAVILLRPDVRVWIDMRAEYWGRERLQEMNQRILEVSWSDLVPSGTTCVLLPDATENSDVALLTTALDRSSAWERLATTSEAVVWVPQRTRSMNEAN